MVDLQHFRKWQKQHPNFMTPHIIHLAEIAGVFIVELSEGTDFNHNPIYGVTVFKMCGNTYNNHIPELPKDINKMVRGRQQAERYFNSVILTVKEYCKD